MLKKGFRLLCLAVMVSFLFIAQAQTEEQGWKKTITLPSGEVVCDLNGEWDSIWDGRGDNKFFGRYWDVVKITQQGNSFEGIRTIGNQHNPKGTRIIKGELDKNGFKEILYYTLGQNQGSCKGKISKDGNTLEITQTIDFDMELKRK